MSCVCAVGEITKRVINPVLSIFLFSQTQKKITLQGIWNQRALANLKFPGKLCPRTDITALTLIFKLGSFLLLHCLNVPEASLLSSKDLDFYKEFYKFKAQCTATLPTCDMSHPPGQWRLRTFQDKMCSIYEERMKEKLKEAQSSSCPYWELLAAGNSAKKMHVPQTGIPPREKPRLCLPCEIPTHVGWK